MDRRRSLMSAHTGTYTPTPIDINNYLTIEALENGLTASLSINACEYCVDGDGNWKTLSANTSTSSINTGQTLSFRDNLIPNGLSGIGTFTISKKCNLKGNCMSMLFGDNAANNYSLSGKSYAFCKLFYNCTNIVNVSDNFLPARTLAAYCYYGMFYGCTNLTTAPALPATTLKGYCYYGMFDGCSNLTTAPALPATTLGSYCYYYMFRGCTSLTTAPVLPATIVEAYCYGKMFYGCTNLTTAPALPATTLAGSCYDDMFINCNKLNYIKMLATDISASNCLDSWVKGVASTGTFVKNSTMTTLSTGTSGIPSGWTVIDAGSYFSFNIKDMDSGDIKTYRAIEGETWADVIGVDPNFNEFGINLVNHVIYNSKRMFQNGFIVYPTDLILPYTYEAYSGSGGGGNSN